MEHKRPRSRASNHEQRAARSRPRRRGSRHKVQHGRPGAACGLSWSSGVAQGEQRCPTRCADTPSTPGCAALRCGPRSACCHMRRQKGVLGRPIGGTREWHGWEQLGPTSDTRTVRYDLYETIRCARRCARIGPGATVSPSASPRLVTGRLDLHLCLYVAS